MQEIQMARKTAAYKVHMDIMAAGEVAAESFSTFCRLLKTMRDDKLYTELEYSSFEAYCENAVGISYRQSLNYIKVLENFGESNLNSSSCLGIKKLQLIGSVPEESREKLLEEAKEMTTREVEKAVREYKFKLNDVQGKYNLIKSDKQKLENELEQNKEHIKKTNKYADEHMQRARDAEFEIEKQKTAMNSLRMELQTAKNQLADAKANGDTEKIKSLEAAIVEQADKLDARYDEIEELKKQLHDKPIEVAATEVIEKEIIPDEVAEANYCKIKYLYEGIKNLTAKEIQIFADHVDPAYYDTLTSDIDEATAILEKISSAAFNATKYEEPDGHCGDCKLADMDEVTEDELEDSKTRCTVTGEIVDFDHSCEKYEKHWRRV